MKKTLINNRWELMLPEHKANRPGWSFWERERLAAMYAAIREGDTIIDVGAEEADMSALFAKWIGESGDIILIEPSEGLWPCIKQTFEANNLKNPFLSFQRFANNKSDYDLEGSFHEYGFSRNIWPDCANGDINPEMGFKHLNEDKDIKNIRLNDLMIHNPDIITIDTEGSEYEILLGAEHMIAERKATWFISVHPEFMRERYNRTPDDLLVLFEKAGYTNTYLGYDHEQHYMFKPNP